MKFINSAQIEHRNSLKEGKIAVKGSKNSNAITSPSGTVVSFGDMIEDRGRYAVVVTVVKDFGSGDVSKTVQLTLT
tara:strand:+ start:3006 stop:3233 length:228 start_codon:yes stop_codon:yes gene_type:complete